jgi:hypothetical protein
MLIIRHRLPKRRPKFAFKWRRYGGRVSTGKPPEIFLVQKTKDSADGLQDSIQEPLYNVEASVNQYYIPSSDNATLNRCYDTLKPFLLVMRAMGVFPVSPTAGGEVLGCVTLSTAC